MLNGSTRLKRTAAGLLVGCGLSLTILPAFADATATQCPGGGCRQVRCVNLGFICINIGNEVAIAAPYGAPPPALWITPDPAYGAFEASLPNGARYRCDNIKGACRPAAPGDEEPASL